MSCRLRLDLTLVTPSSREPRLQRSSPRKLDSNSSPTLLTPLLQKFTPDPMAKTWGYYSPGTVHGKSTRSSSYRCLNLKPLLSKCPTQSAVTMLPKEQHDNYTTLTFLEALSIIRSCQISFRSTPLTLHKEMCSSLHSSYFIIPRPLCII